MSGWWIFFGFLIVIIILISFVIWRFWNYAKGLIDKIKNPLSTLVKKSYGRGAGTPLICDSTKDTDGGLCYNKCDANYKGVGPLCWEKCPTGYDDIGVSCKKPVYDRGVGKIPDSCPEGKEKDGGLCYNKCDANYKGVGPVCWEKCPTGYDDIGVSCKKPTYDRNVGKIPDTCPEGKEKDAGLCYTKCRDGYDGIGPVCWQKCKDGWNSDGAICTRPPDTITRDRKKRADVGRIPDYQACPSGYRTEPVTCFRDYTTTKGSSYCRTRDRLGTCWLWGRRCPEGYYNAGAFCARNAQSITRPSTCRSDEERIGGLCYPKCDVKFGAGWYNPAGDLLFCAKDCPSGYDPSIATCHRVMNSYGKASYGRGVGSPMDCSSDKEKDAGLCYPKPDDGYTCSATICTKDCPTGMRNDGLYCAKRSYGRSVGSPMDCSDDKEKIAGLCYTKPRDGYKCTATICTVKNCPNGMRDDGLYCAKSTKPRGVGIVPDKCESTKNKDGALCYNKCKTGYHGVGPVCWEDMISNI